MSFPKALLGLFAVALVATPQTLTLVSGDGQLIPDGAGLGSLPIVFKLVNGSVPIPNATITFTNTNGSRDTSLSPPSIVTDSDGMASVTFVPSFINGNVYQTYALQAAYGSATVLFHETAGEIPPVQLLLVAPTAAILNPYKATAGQAQTANPIKISVFGSYQGSVQYVAVRLVPLQPAAAPAGTPTQSIQCLEAGNAPEGKVFTDSTGVATCTPIFAYPNAALNTKYDSLSFKVLIGDYYSYGPFAYSISPAPLKLTSTAQLLTLVGQSFSTTLQASGGVAPFTYSFQSGEGVLPPGLLLNSSTGVISGTPTTAGSYKLVALVTDKTGTAATTPLTIGVSSGALQITTVTLPVAVAQQPYLGAVTLVGGVPPYTWTLSGTLPAGMTGGPADSVGDSYKISGTTAVAGTSPITLSVTDSFGQKFGPVGYTIKVLSALAFSTTTLPVATVNVSYKATLLASGGQSPYTYAATNLPSGLVLNAATGVISGATAAAPGAYPIQLSVEDSLGSIISAATTMAVSGGTLAYPANASIPPAAINTPYSSQLPAPVGGVPPYKFSLASTAPAGVNLSASGLLTANLSTAGALNIPIVVTDAAGQLVASTIELNVLSSNPTLTAISNGASFLAGNIAPGELVSIFGSNLGPSSPLNLTLDAAGKVSNTLGTVQVLFDSTPAPLLYVSATQINAVVPFEVTPGAAVTIAVKYGSFSSGTLQATVTGANPSVFILTGTQGAVLNQDYSINGPNKPAAKGSIIQIFGTGSGVFVPPVTDGELPTTISPSPVPGLSLTIGGQPATVTYAGVAPGLVAGVLQVDAVVPDGVTSGAAVPLVLTIGSASSSAQTITIAVQ